MASCDLVYNLQLDFLSEAEMMKQFDHKNIVKLLGVCTRGEPVYAVMEFMLHGMSTMSLLPCSFVMRFFSMCFSEHMKCTNSFFGILVIFQEVDAHAFFTF